MGGGGWELEDYARVGTIPLGVEDASSRNDKFVPFVEYILYNLYFWRIPWTDSDRVERSVLSYRSIIDVE